MVSIKCLCILFMVVVMWGCSTSTSKTMEIGPLAMSESEFAKVGVSKSGSSVGGVFGKAWAEAKRNAESGGDQEASKLSRQFTSDQARQAFKYLCKGGKPRREVSHQFNFVIPKPPAGLPLSKAGEISETYQKWTNAYVASFYRLLSFGRADERMQKPVNYMRFSNIPGPFPFLMVSSDLTSTEFFARLKENRITEPRIGEEDKIEVMMKGFETPVVPVLFRVGSKNRKYIATFLPASDFGDPADNEVVNPLQGFQEIFPYELWSIRENYLLSVSEEEKDSWFQIYRSRREGDINNSLNQIEQKFGNAIPHERLLEERNRIFAYYLVSNTSITQSSTDDGQIQAYKVSLNTEPLCRLGRPDVDFLSK